jgi:salicylate hydroxylase
LAGIALAPAAKPETNSKPLDVFFFGSNLFFGDGKECDRGGVLRLADGGEIEADIIVGADGIHSVVRKSLFGPDAPRFTGCICWRGMASANAVPRDIAIAEGAMWMGPHGHVVHYSVRRGELINIVAHFDSDSWTEESWTRECDMSELTTTYAGWHPDLLRLYPYSARWYKWARRDCSNASALASARAASRASS